MQVFECPDCSTRLIPNVERCDCGWAIPRKQGVPSFCDDRIHSDTGSIESLLEALDGNLRDATENLPRTAGRRELFGDLFDYGRECWRLLVAEHLRGVCLDVSSCTGRRTALLAEQCDTVYSLNSSLATLELLEERDDLDTGSVHPIHGTLESVPFSPGLFDLVTVDVPDMNTGLDALRDICGIVDRLLAGDGTAIFVVRGPAAAIRSPRDFRRVHDRFAPLIRAIRGSAEAPGKIQEVETVAAYALYPDAATPDFAFDATDAAASHWFIHRELTPSSIFERVGRRGLSVARRLGLLPYLFPGYVLVLSKAQATPNDFEDGVVLRGRYRSTIMQADGELEAVFKVPHTRALGRFNETETAAINYVRETNPTVSAVLPDGTAFQTKFGLTRHERPVSGVQMTDVLRSTRDSFQEVLRSGFDWLAALQEPYRHDGVSRSPESVAEKLSYEPLNIEFPPPPVAIDSYMTPVHGDFNQVNVFVAGESKQVASVIDWEFATTEGSPFVDPTNFLLTLAVRTAGDFETALSQIFLDDSAESRIVSNEIHRFCEKLDLSTTGFLHHLPAGLAYRIALNHPYATELSFVTIPETFTPWAQALSEQLPEIVANLDRD